MVIRSLLSYSILVFQVTSTQRRSAGVDRGSRIWERKTERNSGQCKAFIRLECHRIRVARVDVRIYFFTSFTTVHRYTSRGISPLETSPSLYKSFCFLPELVYPGRDTVLPRISVNSETQVTQVNCGKTRCRGTRWSLVVEFFHPTVIDCKITNLSYVGADAKRMQTESNELFSRFKIQQVLLFDNSSEINCFPFAESIILSRMQNARYEFCFPRRPCPRIMPNVPAQELVHRESKPSIIR